MSEIRWCDTGRHAFSANDPDREQYSNTRLKDDRREIIDVCGPCKKGGADAVAAVKSLTSTPAVDAEVVQTGA